MLLKRAVAKRAPRWRTFGLIRGPNGGALRSDISLVRPDGWILGTDTLRVGGRRHREGGGARGDPLGHRVPRRHKAVLAQPLVHASVSEVPFGIGDGQMTATTQNPA